MNKDIWNGYIDSLDNDEIVCILRRDYNLDKELIVSRESLTKDQNNMASLGLVIRFDLINENLEFMTTDGVWI